MEERTGWRGQNESQTEGEEKWQIRWCCRDQQRACRTAQASEKLEHTGLAEKERVASVPQREQLASMSELPLPKGKGTEPSVQSTRAPINSRLNMVMRSPTPLGFGRNGCWPLRGSHLPRALPFILLLCSPHLQNRSPVFLFSPALLLPVFVSSFFSFS